MYQNISTFFTERAGAVLAENFWGGLAPSASRGATGAEGRGAAGAVGRDAAGAERVRHGEGVIFVEFVHQNGEISFTFTDC